MISKFFGITVALGLVFGSIWAGGSGVTFIHFPSLIIVIGVAAGLCSMSCGLNGLFSGIRALFVMPSDSASFRLVANVLRCLAIYTYAGVIIGTMIGLIQMANNMSDLEHLGPGLAYAILTLFYAIVISECVFRPNAHRIEAAINTNN